MAQGLDTATRSGSKPPSVRLSAPVDLRLALVAAAVLLLVVVAASRGNIAADSVDYYAILQRLASPADKPIVGNLHFVEQRSPGYPLAALIPYEILSLVVEPFVSTEKVVPAATSRAPAAPPPPPPPSSGGRLAPPRPPG